MSAATFGAPIAIGIARGSVDASVDELFDHCSLALWGAGSIGDVTLSTDDLRQRMSQCFVPDTETALKMARIPDGAALLLDAEASFHEASGTMIATVRVVS